MLTMRKIIDIPADRRISFDLPESVPSGPAAVSLTVEAEGGAAIEELKRQAAAKTAERKAEGRRPFEGLYGCLKDSEALAGAPADLVKEWRDEW
jgi:hypothetical protein